MNAMLINYASLAAAIVFEVIGTTFLQKSEQFSRLVPTGAMVFFYVISFYLLSQALKGLPLGVAYAMWSGLGIVLTAIVGIVVFKQWLDLPALAGMGLIIAGVVVMNAFSSSVSH
ncbi:DMT family transporter [Rhizobium sp. CAU 1783]